MMDLVQIMDSDTKKTAKVAKLKGWFVAPIIRWSCGGGMKERTEAVGSGGNRRQGRVALLNSICRFMGEFAAL